MILRAAHLHSARDLPLQARSFANSGWRKWKRRSFTTLVVDILRILLPSREHGCKITPSMQHHHDEMSEKKEKNRPHHREMPDPGPVKTTHDPCQPGKLYWFPHCKSGQDRQNPQAEHRRVRQLLKRVVGLAGNWFRSKEKIVMRHGPDSANIARHEQHLAIVSAEHLMSQVEKAGRDVNPHESEVPLQAAAQPSTECESLRPVQQIFLRNLRPETGEGAKNLKAAGHHHQQRNRIQPMREPHRPRMLVDSLLYFPGLWRFNLDNSFSHIPLTQGHKP